MESFLALSLDLLLTPPNWSVHLFNFTGSVWYVNKICNLHWNLSSQSSYMKNQSEYHNNIGVLVK
jgi:hypothetical protein